jgi:hypothetical protein
MDSTHHKVFITHRGVVLTTQVKHEWSDTSASPQQQSSTWLGDLSVCGYLQVPLLLLVSKYSPQRLVLKYPQSKIILNFINQTHTVFVSLKNHLISNSNDMYLDVSNLCPTCMYTWVPCNPFRKGVKDVAQDAQFPSRKIVDRHWYCSVNICDGAKCLIVYVILTICKFWNPAAPAHVIAA